MKKVLRIGLICAVCLLLSAAVALANSTIVGKWSGSGTATAIPITAQAEFTQAGAFGLEVTVVGQTTKLAGQYALSGEQLTLTLPDGTTAAVTCKITGNTMALSGSIPVAAMGNVPFQLTMTRQDEPAAASVKIKDPETANAFVKVGDVYEVVKGAQLPTLQAQVEGTDKKATWKSGKAKVMSINAKGVVKAKKAGTAVISATVKLAKKSSIKDEITVRVVTAAIKQKKATLYVGGTTNKKPATVALTPVILPADASQAAKTVTWSTSDPAVATVDDAGVVTAVATGKANITMTNKYGQKAVCKVTVK